MQWSFVDLAKECTQELCRYLHHCGIHDEDIREAGDVRTAVLQHYLLPSGRYDIDAAAHDLRRWPPIAKRIKKAMRTKWGSI
jgi:hypothetical protein